MPKPFTDAQITAFKIALLNAAYELGTVQGACKAVNISRYTVYEWQSKSPEFRRDLSNAIKRYRLNILKQIADNDLLGRPTYLGVEQAGISYHTYLRWSKLYKNHGTETTKELH